MSRKILVPMNMHNTFRECNESNLSEPRNSNAKVHSFMVPLVSALSKKRPTWTFVSSSHPTDVYGGGFEYAQFDIMDDEKLGTVWCERHWRTGARKFAFDCNRLRAKRERGQFTETKDVKKATKLILENMYAETPAEFMRAASSQASSRITEKLYSYVRAYTRTKDGLMPTLVSLALDHPELVKSHAPQVSGTVDRFLAEHSELVISKTIKSDVDNGKFTLLVERGGRVYSDSPGIASCTLDELSDAFKRAVGVLKLSPVGTLIPGVGFRVSDDTYMAFDGENNDAEGTS